MKSVSITDFAETRSINGITLSPSGKNLAFSVKQADMEGDCYQQHIWVRTPERLFRLTGGGQEGSFCWLDDDTILFPGDRAKRHTDEQPCTVFNRISIHGGEAEEWFVLPFKAEEPVFVDENRLLVLGEYDHNRFTAGEDGALRPRTKEEMADDSRWEIFDELPFWANGKGIVNKKRKRLYLCDIRENTQTPLTPPMMQVSEFRWRAETGDILVVGTEYTDICRQKQQVSLFRLDGSSTCLLPQDVLDIDAAGFLGDQVLLAASDQKRYGTSQNPAFYLLNREGCKLICDPDISLGNSVSSDCAGGGRRICFTGDRVLYLETRGHSSLLMEMDGNGQARPLSPHLPGRIDGFDWKNGVIAYTAIREQGLQEVYLLENGEERQVTRLNEDFLKDRRLAPLHYLPFTDSEGVTIDGWVIEPLDYDPNRSYPAILDVHGGPKTAYGEVFFHEMQFWAAQGYFVFFCNPHGSSGRGNEFSDIFGEQYGVRDYADIMEFTDHVLKHYPQIDEKRVGMTGGSYGGFMANWIVGHTRRFAAVASQRSIANYVSKCLTTDIGYYHNLSALEASPWDNVAQLWDHSPLKYADQAVTPTLFIQSDEDYRCWMGDAIQMFTALKMHGVPARMCLFHGENHELSRSGKPKNRVKRLDEITRWFDQWLKA